MATQGDLSAFVVRQEDAVASCDRARGTLVELIDSFDAIVHPPHAWYKFWSK